MWLDLKAGPEKKPVTHGVGIKRQENKGKPPEGIVKLRASPQDMVDGASSSATARSRPNLRESAQRKERVLVALAQHLGGDALAKSGAVLEAVARASTDDPDMVRFRMLVDDEIAI